MSYIGVLLLMIPFELLFVHNTKLRFWDAAWPHAQQSHVGDRQEEYITMELARSYKDLGVSSGGERGRHLDRLFRSEP